MKYFLCVKIELKIPEHKNYHSILDTILHFCDAMSCDEKFINNVKLKEAFDNCYVNFLRPPPHVANKFTSNIPK